MYIYLKNPLCSYIYEHFTKINKLINFKYEFKSKYNMFDKQNGDIIDFKCSNINSSYKTTNGLIIDEFKYYNSLEFTFNKQTNEVYIYKVPVYIYNNIKIPIFTSDIANIINECVSRYSNIKDIKITFSDNFTPLAIDKNIKEIIPPIINTNNYKTTKKIITLIEKELDNLNKTILSYKQHQDKIIKQMEIIYENKRKIYGLDPINYDSINEFYDAVNNKIKIKVEGILAKIDRHLISTKNAYKKILLTQFTNIYNYKNNTNYNIEELMNLLKEDKIIKNDISSYFPLYDDLLKSDEILPLHNNNYELVEYYMEQIFNYELNSDDGLANRIRSTREDYFDGLGIDKKVSYKNNLYMCYLYEFNNSNFIDFFNGEFGGFLEELDIEEINRCTSTNSNLFKAIDLIIQYDSLIKDKKYYTEIINNPSKVTIGFDKQVKKYGGILQLPYWFITGECIKGDNPNAYDLLMIKPGCSKVDINKITNFDRVKRYNGRRNKYNLNIVNSSRYINSNSRSKFLGKSLNRICITIPASLDIKTIKEIIYIFRNCYEAFYIICEDFTIYNIVKEYIVDLYLEEIKKQLNENANKSSHDKYNKLYNESKRTFVCIDPEYYNNFFKTTPSTNIFYHIYDYTSNYKFRRKKPLCIEDLTELFVNREKETNDFINIDKIKANILGSYDSKDEELLKYNQIDEIKYCSLASVFSDFNKRVDKSGYKSAHIDIFNIIEKENEDARKILSNIEKKEIVMKEENRYKKLNDEELKKVFQLGITDNIQVALYTKNSIFIWKNFPYVPIDIEEINKEEKSKELKLI